MKTLSTTITLDKFVAFKHALVKAGYSLKLIQTNFTSRIIKINATDVKKSVQQSQIVMAISFDTNDEHASMLEKMLVTFLK